MLSTYYVNNYVNSVFLGDKVAQLFMPVDAKPNQVFSSTSLIIQNML